MKEDEAPASRDTRLDPLDVTSSDTAGPLSGPLSDATVPGGGLIPPPAKTEGVAAPPAHAPVRGGVLTPPPDKTEVVAAPPVILPPTPARSRPPPAFIPPQPPGAGSTQPLGAYAPGGLRPRIGGTSPAALPPPVATP